MIQEATTKSIIFCISIQQLHEAKGQNMLLGYVCRNVFIAWMNNELCTTPPEPFPITDTEQVFVAKLQVQDMLYFI